MRYIIITLVLFFLELIYFMIAERYNIIDQPNNGSSYSNSTVVSLTLCQNIEKTPLTLIQKIYIFAFTL